MVRGGVAKEGLKRLLTDPRLLEALAADRQYPHIQLDKVRLLYWQMEDFGLVPK